MHILNLDANASLPPTQSAKDALRESLSFEGNPSSPHILGRKQRQILDQARNFVASAMGGKEKELIFTSGASESNRWLVDASMATGKLKTWVSELEHPSLAKPLARAFETGALIRVTDTADADILFSTAAHNETGLITDWNALIAQARPDTILVADISQSFGRLEDLPTRVDALVASAHKMGGFPGSGALLLRGNAKRLKNPWTGGGQEGNLRPGTEAIHLIHAFGKAASEIASMRAANQALAPLRDQLEQELLQIWPFAQRTPKTGERLPNTSALTLNGVDGSALRILIDSARICVGFGSACSALAPEPSPALLSLGLTPEQAKSTIRFSLCPGTSQQMVNEAIDRLKILVLPCVPQPLAKGPASA